MAYLLARQYELTTPIGRGPTGEVWRATDLNTRDTVAVKVLDAGLSRDPAIVERFVRERQVLTAFLHPAFVRVRDLIAGDGVIALVMEYVNGWDLRRHVGHSGGLSPGVAAEIGRGVADALAAAHEAGVVHCDLKPSNVLLEEPAGIARLTDCRVARLAHGYQGPAAWYTSPEHVSPEVIGGGPPVPATDVYALGLILHEMLTGAPPYHGADPETVLAAHLRGEPAVPVTVAPHLRHLVEECLAREPAARPSAREVAQRLAYVQTSPALDSAWRETISAAETQATAATAIASGPSEPAGSAATTRARADAPVAAAPPTRSARIRRIAIVSGAIALAAVLAGVATALFVTGRDEPRAGGNAAAASEQPNGGTIDTPRPNLPASAAPETLEGATAFAHHWFEALTYAIGTGNTDGLQAVSSPQCRACADAATVVRDGYRDQSTLRGGGYTVRTVSADDFWNLQRPALRIVFDRSPRSAVGADGQLVEVFGGGSFLTCQILLDRPEGRWRVLEVLAPVPIA